MGKVNTCLRCFFIFFNVVFAALGCFLFYGTVQLTNYSRQAPDMGTPSLGWSWVFSLGILGVSCLGIYAGYSEKLLPLKIFTGFMAAGVVVLVILGMMMVVGRNKVTEMFQLTRAKLPEVIMEDESLREMLKELELEAHCCGVWSPEDWGSSVPDSCDCSYATEGLAVIGLGTSGCRPRPGGTDGPDEIYPRPCGDVMTAVIDLFLKVAMCIFFGMAVTALLGLLMSYLMIRQVKGHDGASGAGFPMKGQYL